MSILAKQMKAIVLLQKNETPLFWTWSAAKFGHVFEEILLAYSTEFKVKTLVAENFGSCESENKMSFFIAAWMYQVYVDEKTNLSLEKLLLETGHRPHVC